MEGGNKFLPVYGEGDRSAFAEWWRGLSKSTDRALPRSSTKPLRVLVPLPVPGRNVCYFNVILSPLIDTLSRRRR